MSSNTRALPWDQLLAFFTSLNGSISWSSPAQTMGSTFMSDKNGRFSCSLCISNLLKMICRTDGQIPPPPQTHSEFVPRDHPNTTNFLLLKSIPNILQETDELRSQSVHSCLSGVTTPTTKQIGSKLVNHCKDS